MPSESTEHSTLVEGGAMYIRRTYSNIKLLSTDTFSPLGAGRLIPLLDHQPDIVTELTGGRIIIGEAKTDSDALRPHSQEQYKSFITYLSQLNPQGIFLLFCSWKVAPGAYDWLRNYMRKQEGIEVSWEVVSDVDVTRRTHDTAH